jgi:hypothetical protein
MTLACNKMNINFFTEISEMKRFLAITSILACSLPAHAAPLFSDAGFGAGDSVVTFNEVPVAAGASVAGQFGALGVSFSTNGPGSWYASNDPDAYSGNPGFAGRYLDSFTGGTHASIYSILFANDVDSAGAYWEFNTSSPAATFSAYLNNVLVESFNYNNASCCSSTEFIGFSSVVFDEIRISNITSTDFIMDTLRFSPASAVPEPGALALLGLGLAGLVFSRRKTKA